MGFPTDGTPLELLDEVLLFSFPTTLIGLKSYFFGSVSSATAPAATSLSAAHDHAHVHAQAL